MKRIAVVLSLVAVVAVGVWGAHQVLTPGGPGSLARFMPQGALLFVEARDFSGMLQEWNSSREKAAWVASANHEVFSRSRLYERLSQAQDEFAAAAGVPTDGKFLGQVAGRNTAIGIYDIGKLELLYIARMPSTEFAQSTLWQQRLRFEPREVNGRKFYVRTDPQSGRVAAFAAQDDVVMLATREDLIAGAVALLAGQKMATLEEQSWFAEALKQAPHDAGELRMVVHLAEVAMTPQFRTYWIPHNITEMRQYESTVSDFSREQIRWQEERVLLLKKEPEQSSDAGAKAVADLVRLVPAEVDFHSASANPEPKQILARIEETLTPRPATSADETAAPTVALSDGTTGSESNLDVDISAAPPSYDAKERPDAKLEQLLTKANVQSSLQLYRSVVAPDGVFVGLHSAMVLTAEQPWNENAVRDALQRAVAPSVTTGMLGAGWRTVGRGPDSFQQLDGLLPIATAVRGKYLVLGNDPELVSAVLGRVQQKVTAEPAIYVAGFDHQRERANYYRITALIDHASLNANAADGNEPHFFSQDVASLSKVLSRVKSQTVVRKRSGAIERQTVTYEWEQ